MIYTYHSKRISIKSNQKYESNVNISNGLDFSVGFLNENYQQPEQQQCNDRSSHTTLYIYYLSRKQKTKKNNQNKNEITENDSFDGLALGK